MKDALFVYGTLAPGRKNHHRLQQLPGRWETGSVRGRLIQAGWAAADGFPALHPDPNGELIPGYVLCSEGLSGMWAELDNFEGDDYERQPIQVTCDNGETVQAFIYALVSDPAKV